MGKVLKWIGIVVGGLIVLILVVAVALGLVGYSKISKKYQVGEAFTAPKTPEALARGKYLLTSTTGCLGCRRRRAVFLPQ